MRDDLSKLLQKSNSFLEKLEDHPLVAAREAVENACILDMESPARRVVQAVLSEMEPGSERALGRVLIEAFLLNVVRSERHKQKIAETPLLPGFEHLPVRILSPKGQMIDLLDANYWAVLCWYWALMRQVKARKRSNPRVKEAKALLGLMASRVKKDKKDRGITVREVVLIDGGGYPSPGIS